VGRLDEFKFWDEVRERRGGRKEKKVLLGLIPF
jgi:hypothetical protein